tara:strand:- start:1243 stop:1443 length:201 start_codon:yes stop_codon:yes gene_type:complete
MKFISKKYIRNAFKVAGLQINEESVDKISESFKIKVGSLTLISKDLGYKRITEDKVEIILGEYDAS